MVIEWQFPDRFEIHIENIYRQKITKDLCQRLSKPVPLEKLSQEPLPTGDSCVLVIFGASGDLRKRTLMPGLYNLACEGCMNPGFEVLGIGRTPMSAEEFRKKTGEAAAKSKDTREFSESGWEDFEQRLHYMVGDINDPTFYPELRNRLDEMEKRGSSPNHLFYVSNARLSSKAHH
jgi:glucose-6-phosphate 1-dehydrogenase